MRYLDEGEVMLLAKVPPAKLVQTLFDRLELGKETRDLHVAYEGSTELRLAGFIVSEAGSLDRLLAFCPLSAGLEVASTLWRLEIHRQLARARSLCQTKYIVKPGGDFVWLGFVNEPTTAIPRWIYSLSCVPVEPEWTGKIRCPSPFCPELFARMASQPAASVWLARTNVSGSQMNEPAVIDPAVSAGLAP